MYTTPSDSEMFATGLLIWSWIFSLIASRVLGDERGRGGASLVLALFFGPLGLIAGLLLPWEPLARAAYDRKVEACRRQLEQGPPPKWLHYDPRRPAPTPPPADPDRERYEADRRAFEQFCAERAAERRPENQEPSGPMFGA